MKTAILAACIAACIYVSLVVALEWFRGQQPRDFNDK